MKNQKIKSKKDCLKKERKIKKKKGKKNKGKTLGKHYEYYKQKVKKKKDEMGKAKHNIDEILHKSKVINYLSQMGKKNSS